MLRILVRPGSTWHRLIVDIAPAKPILLRASGLEISSGTVAQKSETAHFQKAWHSEPGLAKTIGKKSTGDFFCKDLHHSGNRPSRSAHGPTGQASWGEDPGTSMGMSDSFSHLR